MTATGLSALCLAVPAQADCLDHAAAAHGIDAALLRAVATVESGLNPVAVNRSHLARTGTTDIGLLQVNTSWLPRLRPLGITERDLFDACINARVGAWILADSLRRHGNRWEAIGAYNAACTQLVGERCQAARASYAWKVHRRLAHAGSPRTSAASMRVAAPAVPVPAPGLLSLRLPLADGSTAAALPVFGDAQPASQEARP